MQSTTCSKDAADPCSIARLTVVDDLRSWRRTPRLSRSTILMAGLLISLFVTAGGCKQVANRVTARDVATGHVLTEARFTRVQVVRVTPILGWEASCRLDPAPADHGVLHVCPSDQIEYWKVAVDGYVERWFKLRRTGAVVFTPSEKDSGIFGFNDYSATSIPCDATGGVVVPLSKEKWSWNTLLGIDKD